MPKTLSKFSAFFYACVFSESKRKSPKSYDIGLEVTFNQRLDQQVIKGGWPLETAKLLVG